jgi:hypothetical protein
MPVPDYVLWRRLTRTDFNAMNGNASPHGRGGGAMHISLGVHTDNFPIRAFLNARRRQAVTVTTAPLRRRFPAASITVATNPTRRRGEWLIRDQFSHRHPAWTTRAGFPIRYNERNPPYILIFRVGGTFHVRHATSRRMWSLRSAIPESMSTASKGIERITRGLLRYFRIESKSTFEEYEEKSDQAPADAFDPKDIEDGRRKVLRAVYRRQGQRGFRRMLMSTYAGRCAITGKQAEWVLEAAHIAPYLGAKTNTVTNGLLLRADIHTLFDLALISIDPDERTIKVSKLLKGTEYAKLDGKKLAEPRAPASRPSTAAFREHFSGFEP